MLVLIPEIVTNDITVKLDNFCTQFLRVRTIFTRNLHLLLDNCGALLELSGFIVVVDIKLRIQYFVFISRQCPLQSLLGIIVGQPSCNHKYHLCSVTLKTKLYQEMY